jgi:hypothetical protein
VLVIGRFLIPTAIVLGIFVYMHGGDSKSVTATISQSCGATTGTVSATIDWPAPAIAPDETWVDLGIAPGFPAGSFQGHGPIAPPSTSTHIEGLPAGLKVFYRINTKRQDGWRTALTGSFTADCTASARAKPTPAVDVIHLGQ